MPSVHQTQGAFVIAVVIMLLAATPPANFGQANPAIVILALGILLLIEGLNMLSGRARSKRNSAV